MAALLKADPHNWGEGRIHELDPDEDKTLCGQMPFRCPGHRFEGRVEEITCKACLRSREARANADRWRIEWEARKQEAEQRQLQWWVHYDAYLESPEWKRRRAMVLERARGMCEACMKRRAVMVHHRSYPQGCVPGSEEWLRKEKLFDLVAICDDCHDDVHS